MMDIHWRHLVLLRKLLTVGIGLLLFILTSCMTAYIVSSKSHGIHHKSSSLQAWTDSAEKVVISQRDQIKVYMFAYMRGGSTFGGQLFDQDPNAILWYEPLDQFYMAYLGHSRFGLPKSVTMNDDGSRRELPTEERDQYLNYIYNILECQYNVLPVETLGFAEFMSKSSAMEFSVNCVGTGEINSCKQIIRNYCGSDQSNKRNPGKAWMNKCPQIIRFLNEAKPVKYSEELDMIIRQDLELYNHSLSIKSFVDHYSCIQKISLKQKPCLVKIMDRCQRRKIQALEILRSNMNALDDLMVKVPDLKVIYYIRDPRGILSSIWESDLKSPEDEFEKEALILCSKMTQDFADYLNLKRKYPKAFQMVRYEDLVRDPIGVGDQIYRNLGMQASSKEWKKFALNAIHGDKDSGIYGLVRRNGTASIDKWRRKLSENQITAATRICYSVIEQLQYPLQ